MAVAALSVDEDGAVLQVGAMHCTAGVLAAPIFMRRCVVMKGRHERHLVTSGMERRLVQRHLVGGWQRGAAWWHSMCSLLRAPHGWRRGGSCLGHLWPLLVTQPPANGAPCGISSCTVDLLWTPVLGAAWRRPFFVVSSVCASSLDVLRLPCRSRPWRPAAHIHGYVCPRHDPSF